MAVATSSSSAALVKALVLPFILVLLVVAAGASSAEDGPAVAESGGRVTSETPGARKLLQFIKLCGPGSAPNFSCKNLLFLAKNATCCSDVFGNQACFDVGGYDVTKCGSCTTKCKVGEFCCSGVCANLLNNKNNCGVCGNRCKGTLKCNFGFCGY